MAARCSECGVGVGGAHGLSSHLTAPRLHQALTIQECRYQPASDQPAFLLLLLLSTHHAPSPLCRDPPRPIRLPLSRPSAPLLLQWLFPSGAFCSCREDWPQHVVGPALFSVCCHRTAPQRGGPWARAAAGVSRRHRGTPLTVLPLPAQRGRRQELPVWRELRQEPEHDSTLTVVSVKSDHVIPLLKTS